MPGQTEHDLSLKMYPNTSSLNNGFVLELGGDAIHLGELSNPRICTYEPYYGHWVCRAASGIRPYSTQRQLRRFYIDSFTYWGAIDTAVLLLHAEKKLSEIIRPKIEKAFLNERVLQMDLKGRPEGMITIPYAIGVTWDGNPPRPRPDFISVCEGVCYATAKPTGRINAPKQVTITSVAGSGTTSTPFSITTIQNNDFLRPRVEAKLTKNDKFPGSVTLSKVGSSTPPLLTITEGWERTYKYAITVKSLIGGHWVAGTVNITATWD